MKEIWGGSPYLIPHGNPPNLPPGIRVAYAPQVALLEAQVGQGREVVASRAGADARAVERLVLCLGLVLILLLVFELELEGLGFFFLFGTLLFFFFFGAFLLLLVVVVVFFYIVGVDGLKADWFSLGSCRGGVQVVARGGVALEVGGLDGLGGLEGDGAGHCGSLLRG